MTPPRLSFVIPAKNEARYVGRCLGAIGSLAGRLDHEVILVDNGSTDGTADIARSTGATVLTKATGTIGSLRNEGARHATGDVIVFVDADVVITEEWARNIGGAIARLQADPRHVTGSHCFAPDSDPPLLRTWFNSFASEPDARHLGSGHLIVNRGFFHEVGGFSEVLETGEDYDFCVRAEKAGADIRNDVSLVVYHLDFPKTMKAFVKRETWHGRGDLQSWQAASRSKVVLGSGVFLLLHLLLLITLVAGSLRMSLVVLVALLGLLLASSFHKFRHRSWRDIAGNAAVFYPYFWGRISSIRYLTPRAR